MTERILVVGHSAITCLGSDTDSTWAGLLAGKSGIRRHPALSADRYLQDIAGMVEGIGPGTAGEDPAVSRLSARSIHFAVASAREAWSDAGLAGKDFDRDRVAVVIGSAFGGQDLLESEQQRSLTRKSLSMSPYLIPALVINQAAGQVAQLFDLHGPSVAPSNACATGVHSIALAAMFLRMGEADLAIAGGTESAFTPAIVNGFATMKALLGRRSTDRSADDPSQASRPFSADRAGFVMSEGAGTVILATESAARRLGLRVQAEYLGHSINTDGFHMAMPHGATIEKCLRQVLTRCGLTPEDIDYYNAHGTSTIVNDRVETQAIKTIFGPHSTRMPISSVKGAIGHSLGAASAIEAVICLRVLRDQIIPPTINYVADPELDLDYVPNQARSTRVDTVMSASFGFGGTNNAILMKRWVDE